MLPITKISCWKTADSKKFFTLEEAEHHTNTYLSEIEIDKTYFHNLKPGDIALYDYTNRYSPEDNHSYKVKITEEKVYKEWEYNTDLKRICLTKYNTLYTQIVDSANDIRAFHSNAISSLTKL